MRPYESRTVLKISLGTRDQKEAQRKASIYNDYIEDYWRNLIKSGGAETPSSRYRAAVQLARAHGFAYKSVAEIAKAPLTDIIARINTSSTVASPQIVSSALGAVELPRGRKLAATV